MPKIQLAPKLTLVPTLTAENYLADYNLLGFKENDLGFIPVSLLVPSASSGWNVLTHQIGSACQNLHLITVQALTDLILIVVGGSASKLYASVNNSAWDQETATALEYYAADIKAGGYTFEDGNEYLSLRADAHENENLNNVQRLRISGAIATSNNFLLMFYQGFIESPTFYLEEVPQ